MSIISKLKLLRKRLQICKAVFKEWYPWDYASMLVLMREHLNLAVVDQIQAQHVGNGDIAAHMIKVRDAINQLIDDEYDAAYTAKQEYEWYKVDLWDKYSTSPRKFLQFLPEPLETQTELEDGTTVITTDNKHPDVKKLNRLHKKFWDAEIKARKDCFEVVANAFLKEEIRSWWS